MADTLIELPTSLQYQTSPSSMTVTMTNVSSTSTSPFNLQTQSYEFPGDRIDVSITMAPMSEIHFQQWQAIFLRLRGSAGTFNLPFYRYLKETSNKSDMYDDWPQAYGIVNSPSGNIGKIGGSTITAGFLKGSSTASVGSHATAFKAGEWLYIDWAGEGGRQSVHRVLEDAGTDSNGIATFRVWPNLREEKTGGAFSYIRNYGELTVRLQENSFSFTKTIDGLYRISFDVAEAL